MTRDHSGDPTTRRHLTTVTDTTTDPTNPHTNPTLEREVLAALITAPRAHETHTQNTLDTITDHTFTTPLHRDLIAAIRTTWDNGHDLDGETIYRALNTHRAGLPPLPYLAFYELIEGDHSIPLAPGHVQALNDLAERRIAYDASNTLRLISYTPDITTLRPRLTAALTEALNDTPTTLTPTQDTWTPLNLTELLATDTDPSPIPNVLTRKDGTNLLYPGAIHSVSGEPGSGKSWLAVLGAAQQITTGHPVLYIDFEDQPATFIGRLRDLGTPDTHINNHLRYIRPETALNATNATHLDKAAEGCNYAVIDGITEAMTLHNLSLNDNEDVARFLALIPHRLANLGLAVLQIDHVVKDSEARGRYAIGGQHKLAGITGAAYKAVISKSMGRGVKGVTRIIVDKDKHGRVGPTGVTVAELTLDARNLHPDQKWTRGQTETAQLWLDAPATTTNTDGTFRPTHLMEKVSRYVEVNPDATLRSIITTVKGNQTALSTAIEVLINDGHLTTTQGARRATLHTSVRPYREDDDR